MPLGGSGGLFAVSGARHSAVPASPGLAIAPVFVMRTPRFEYPERASDLDDARRGDSDAHIVRGLVALALAIYSGRSAAEILATDAFETYERLGLAAHLTPQRSNGVRSMIERIKSDARAAAGA